MSSRVKALLLAWLVAGTLSLLVLLTNAAVAYSDRPEFCLKCHSMEEAYLSHQNSTHKQFKCTECHAPHSYFPKVAYKTKAGLRDLYVTVTGKVPPVIRATAASREIIKENCIRCHYTTVEKVNMGEGRFCTDCHRRLPHGERKLVR